MPCASVMHAPVLPARTLTHPHLARPCHCASSCLSSRYLARLLRTFGDDTPTSPLAILGTVGARIAASVGPTKVVFTLAPVKKEARIMEKALMLDGFFDQIRVSPTTRKLAVPWLPCPMVAGGLHATALDWLTSA